MDGSCQQKGPGSDRAGMRLTYKTALRVGPLTACRCRWGNSVVIRVEQKGWLGVRRLVHVGEALGESPLACVGADQQLMVVELLVVG
eukprot:scaffold28091_cov22-Prasinocladus_malaysianus.AAC.1